MRCYRAVYETWRAKGAPLTVGKLHHNIMADFSRPIGGIGVFVVDKESASGTLQVLHSAQSYPGSPGVSRDRLTTFLSEGDVDGLDIATVAFDENQLAITADVIVPGSVDHMLQLLADEPTK
jgi:hypothetical protein